MMILGYRNQVLKDKQFTTEDMIEFGQMMATKKDANPESVKFHMYVVDMLQYEEGIGSMADHMIGKRKTFINAMKAGSKAVGFAAMTMRTYAKTSAQELKLRKTWAFRRILKAEKSLYDKVSMEGFYYRTGERYLKALGFR